MSRGLRNPGCRFESCHPCLLCILGLSGVPRSRSVLSHRGDGPALIVSADPLVCCCETVLVNPCPSCGLAQDRLGQRYCRECHNAYMRRWRATRGGHAALTAEERIRGNARSYLNTYVRRGKVRRGTSCQECGAGGVRIEGHHHNGYDNPLDVQWLCRLCHRAVHAG